MALPWKGSRRIASRGFKSHSLLQFERKEKMEEPPIRMTKINGEVYVSLTDIISVLEFNPKVAVKSFIKRLKKSNDYYSKEKV